MKIKNFKISGFRSIRDLIEIPLTGACAIVGANNVGKTNILQALHCVLGRDWITVNSFDETDVYNEEHDRDIVVEITFDQPYEFHQYEGVEPVEIPKIRFFYTRYKVGEYKGQRRLEKKCLTLDDKEVFVLSKKPKKGEKHQYTPLTTIPQQLQESIPVILIGSDRSLRNHLPYARNSMLGVLLKDINNDFLLPNNNIELTSPDGSQESIPRSMHFTNCIKAAVECLQTTEFKALERSIKQNVFRQLGFDIEKDAEAIDIYFGPLTSLDFYRAFSFYVKEYGHSINAIELGGGFQNAIVIAILKAFEERKKQGALFLIEEPEMFLHPQMQRSLYKTIRKISESNQVIYVTHSPHFVAIPEFHDVVLVTKDSNGTKVRKSDLDSNPRLIEKFRKELDPERNELFFSKRLLIVEGDTEKLALPEYAKRMDKDIDKVGATIIEVGGKRNIIDFVELALSFGIPVGFCYDIDSSDFSDHKEETDYNSRLDGYKNKGVPIWEFTNKYEDELRKFFGEADYQKVCAKFEKNSRAIRARLTAADTSLAVPEFIKPIITWLAD